MNIRQLIFTLCVLTTVGYLTAMDQGHFPDLHDFIHPARAGQSTLFAIQHGELGTTHIQNQYIKSGSQQDYEQGQPFFSQIPDTFKSGLKQSVFDIAHCPGKFFEYGANVAATLVVHSFFDFFKGQIIRLWYKKELEKQEAQRNLAELEAEAVLIQNIGIQLKNFSVDSELYRKLKAQQALIISLHIDRMTAHMTAQASKCATSTTCIVP
jgi:hypothetical protein